MDLKYEAVYRMVQIASYKLIDTFDELENLPHIVECMLLMKINIVHKSVSHTRTLTKQIGNNSTNSSKHPGPVRQKIKRDKGSPESAITHATILWIT